MRQLLKKLYDVFFKRRSEYKITPEAGLQTAALLAKNLRRLSPLVAFVGRQGLSPDQRRLAVAILGEELDKDEDVRKDILTIIRNLMGEDVEFDIEHISKNFPKAWRKAKMEKYIFASVRLGIFEREDLSNLGWIVNNWMQSPEVWEQARSRLDALKSPNDTEEIK